MVRRLSAAGAMMRAVPSAAVGLGLAAGLLATPAPATAHPLAPALLEWIEQPLADGPGRFSVRWRVDMVSAAEPVLPTLCRASGTGSVRADARLGFVERRWTVDCGTPGIAGATLAIDGLAADRRDALIRVQWRDGVVARGLLRADAPGWRVPERPDRWAVLVDHVQFGMRHLAAGPDHWLFVLGLLALLRGARAIVLAVSAFTAGHAMTLSLAVLGVVSVPSRPVEVAIAATLVALAYELAQRHGTSRRHPQERSSSLLSRRPAQLAFGFGLVHGLGFAGVLTEAGLPPGEVPLALLGFNLGIEAGQLLLVAMWVAAGVFAARVSISSRSPRAAAAGVWLRRLRPLPAHALGGLGVYWALDRMF